MVRHDIDEILLEVALNTTVYSLEQQRNLSETTVYKVKVSDHFIFPGGIVSLLITKYMCLVRERNYDTTVP
jgi:hypothetical protein